MGCFRAMTDEELADSVSVPLRGVGCFWYWDGACAVEQLFPSPCGVWVVSSNQSYIVKIIEFPSPCGVWVVSWRRGCAMRKAKVSVPLRGVGCFKRFFSARPISLFPSPCGVWVVSAKLHILSGATGKRIVNSAILLYHIGRCLSIAN